MTTDLKKFAERNRAYYLEEQEADKKENRWFRYIKTMDSYSEPVLITPTMAKEVLEHCRDEFDLRRPADPKRIEQMAKTLESQVSHTTIAFSFSGKLLDGRLILEVIAASKPAIVFVSFNVSDKFSFLFE